MLQRLCHRIACAMVLGGLLALPTHSLYAQSTPSLAAIPDHGGADAEQKRGGEGSEELQSLIERKQQWRARRAEFLSAWHGAADELAKVQTQIEEVEAQDDARADLKGTATELAQRLQVTEQELSLARKSQRAVQDDVERMSSRRRRLPELLAAAKVKLRRLEALPTPVVAEPLEAETGPSDPGAPVDQALLAEARLNAMRAEVDAYDAELNSHSARAELLDRRAQLAELRTSHFASRVDGLRKAVRSAQREQVRVDTERARSELAAMTDWPKPVHTAVVELAAQNTKLADAWTGEEGLVEKIETVSERLSRARAQVASVEAEFERIATQVEVAGLGDTVGALLRKERAEAPDVGMYQRFVRLRKEQLAAAQLQQVLLNEQRDKLTDLDQRSTEFLRELPVQVPAGALRDQVRKVVRGLLADQRRYLDALIADHEAYVQHLIEFDEEQRQLVERSQALIDFIDERVLWVPSGTAASGSLLRQSALALRWLSDADLLEQLLRAVMQLLASTPLSCAAIALLLSLFVFLRPRLRAHLRTLSTREENPLERGFSPTLRVGFITLVWLLPAPLSVLWFAEQLSASPNATLYVRSLAGGLSATTLLWLSLRALRCVLVPFGLAAARAGWPAAACKVVHRQIGFLAAALLPLNQVVFTLETRAEDGPRESLARLCFIVACGACALFGHAILRTDGSLSPVLKERKLGLQRPWVRPATHAMMVAIPCLLALAALLGYYWTALQLAIRQHWTWLLLFVLLLMSDLLARWAAKAKLRVEQARAQAEQALLAATPTMDVERPSLLLHPPPTAERPRLDIETVSDHTNRLTRLSLMLVAALGLATIWADLVPAAGVLREVELWHTTQEVAVSSPGTDGQEVLTTERREVPITLSDVGFSLLVAGMSFVLLRSVPGFVEVTLFRRVHNGERYAYSTIIKYAIGLTGAALSLEAIGVSWANVQWLVAAVGLGLGFGLQEIFANFVSGLIILFERPLRVGDTITVDGTSGVVSRIHIRATHITSFDRKELVVPNKELVTSKLINWSLSDAVLRVTVPVGLAYGSDTKRASELLREVAQKNPLVLRDPEPQVLFLRFDDSSLGFELRAFVAETGHNLQVLHELNMAIDQTFRAAGIEIAFPQRDINLRSLPAQLGSVQVVSAAPPHSNGSQPRTQTGPGDA